MFSISVLASLPFHSGLFCCWNLSNKIVKDKIHEAPYQPYKQKF